MHSCERGMAMRAWHALVGEKPIGPMSSAELLRAYVRGQDNADSLVAAGGADAWQKLSEAFPLADLVPPPVPGADAFSTGEAVAPSKPKAWASDTPYAWRRYVARQIDT